jgi:hypothetical protein
MPPPKGTTGHATGRGGPTGCPSPGSRGVRREFSPAGQNNDHDDDIRDDRTVLRATSADELREKINTDYAERPVSRELRP